MEGETMRKKQSKIRKSSGDTGEGEIGEIKRIPIAEEIRESGRKSVASQFADRANPLSHHLAKVSNISAWKCHEEKDDVQQIYLLKMWVNSKPIRNPKAWLNTVASNSRKNAFRHQEKVDNYVENLFNKSRESTRHNGKPLIQSSNVLTPEQELLDRERQSLLNKAMRRALEGFPPEIVEAWLMEKDAKEIHQETGTPLSSVYRILKRMQKAIIAAKEEFENLR
jgi:RNA polymerase sigma factor (sigma-70 family)